MLVKNPIAAAVVAGVRKGLVVGAERWACAARVGACSQYRSLGFFTVPVHRSCICARIAFRTRARARKAGLVSEYAVVTQCTRLRLLQLQYMCHKIMDMHRAVRADRPLIARLLCRQTLRGSSRCSHSHQGQHMCHRLRKMLAHYLKRYTCRTSGHAANSMLCPSAVYECTDAASEQSKSAQSAHTYSPDSSVNRLSSAHESSLEEAATVARAARKGACGDQIELATIAVAMCRHRFCAVQGLQACPIATCVAIFVLEPGVVHTCRGLGCTARAQCLSKRGLLNL
eukprot:SAG11_NODE_60_length_19094_cov_26.549566_3_plen_285_part_00